MPKKLTYEEIKNNIEEIGESKLLSTEYVNSGSSLLFKCKCGNNYKTSYKKYMEGQYCCPKCSYAKIAIKNSFSLDEVIKRIELKGCKYVSGEYKNNYSKLKIRCACGNVFERDFNHFNRGQINCQECANKKTSIAKIKYNINTLKDIVSQRNYEIIGGEYKTCITPMDCRCPKGHIFKVKLINVLYGKYGCQVCQHEYQRGENHPMYKGGESEVLDNLRKIIKDWKIAIATKYGGRCALTDTKGDCVVHHIKSFNTLIKETFDELNLPICRKLKDYTNQQWLNICDLFIKKHTMENGILLQRKVHNKFHSLYGKGDNNITQFYEFVEIYYPHKIKQIKYRINYPE